MLLPLLLLGASLPAAASTGVCADPNAPLSLTVSSSAYDEVSNLLAKGKKQLVDAKYADAVATFETAHQKSGGKVETELWLLRARMSAGSLDESFDRIVELESQSENPADAAYAIGVGRYLYAKREEARGGQPGGPFDEARGYLKDAVDADAAAYPDAWRMLAESARFTGDAETASMAIESAREQKKDDATLGLAAKIRISKAAG
ncbi:MAG: hypothetical protein AAGG01_13610, partial [Planctomycetota bacterium]